MQSVVGIFASPGTACAAVDALARAGLPRERIGLLMPGTPPREVERLLLRAAHQHANVLKEPAPDVILADLGAEVLQFKLRAWTNLRQTRRVQVESDLRFAIEELCSARGIVMGHRQRDLHHGKQPQTHLKAA